MIKGTLTRLAFVAGCAIALAFPAAQAQTLDSQIVMYDRLLELNPAYRESRIIRECGPITNAHLQAGCVDSVIANEKQRSLGLRDGYTGDSSGRMNRIDRTFQGPEMYDPRFGR
jgi:hypothetical protein